MLLFIYICNQFSGITKKLKMMTHSKHFLIIIFMHFEYTHVPKYEKNEGSVYIYMGHSPENWSKL